MRLALTAAALYGIKRLRATKRDTALRLAGHGRPLVLRRRRQVPERGGRHAPIAAGGDGGYSREPQLFEFWADTNYDYEVALARPLGIVFEEIGTAAQPQGVKVIDVGGNAAASGKVSVGDVLVGVTAVRYIGGEYLGKRDRNRTSSPRGRWVDTVVDAISSERGAGHGIASRAALVGRDPADA